MAASAQPAATTIDSDLAPIFVVIENIPIVISYIARTSLSFLYFSLWLIRSIFYPSLVFLSPLTLLLSVLLYLFAPAIVLAQVSLDILVFSPYRFAVYLVDAIYPVYVFCGIASIVGVVIGLLARRLVVQIEELVKYDEEGRRESEYKEVKLEEDQLLGDVE